MRSRYTKPRAWRYSPPPATGRSSSPPATTSARCSCTPPRGCARAPVPAVAAARRLAPRCRHRGRGPARACARRLRLPRAGELRAGGAGVGGAALRGLPPRPVPACWPARGAAASWAAEGGSACPGRARRASEPAAWRVGGGTEAHVRALVHLRDDDGEAHGRRRPWQRQADRGCRRRSRAGPPSPRRAPCSLPPSPARRSGLGTAASGGLGAGEPHRPISPGARRPAAARSCSPSRCRRGRGAARPRDPLPTPFVRRRREEGSP